MPLTKRLPSKNITTSRVLLGAAVIAVACMGLYLQNALRAATPTANVEIESGTRTGTASLVSDVTASGAAAVRFNQAGTPPPDGVLTLTQYNAAMSKRVVFGHQSVGYQAIQGVQMWADDLNTSDPNVIDVESGTVPATGGFFGHLYAGTNGDARTKTAELLSLLQNGLAAKVDIVVLKFCYADLRSNSGYTPQQMFNTYKTWVDTVESSFPNLKVIYATEAIVMGANSDGGANNVLRQTYNNLVRAQYASSGRLWDVAKIESTDPSGNRVLHNGVESLYSGYASPDQRHIYGLGRTTVSAPLLQLIAQL